MMRIILQRVRGINNEILGVKGLRGGVGLLQDLGDHKIFRENGGGICRLQ